MCTNTVITILFWLWNSDISNSTIWKNEIAISYLLLKSQTREERQTMLEFTSILDKSQFDNFLGSDDSLKI